MSKRAYERRLRRKREEEKRARRRARRMRTLTIWGVAVAVVGLGLGLGLALTGGGGEPAAAPTPSPSPTGPPTPIAGCTDPGTVAPKSVSFPSPPAATIDEAKRYTAVMETSCGRITIALDPKLAPKTVNSIVFLARRGFYDRTMFHRVQKESTFAIVQGGDPKGDGTGGPGYQYGGETPPASTKYLRGVVAMANSGDPSSNGSQFFFVVNDWPDLPPNFTVFGKVTDARSLAVLDRMIKAQGPPLGGGLGLRPEPPIAILRVTIRES